MEIKQELLDVATRLSCTTEPNVNDIEFAEFCAATYLKWKKHDPEYIPTKEDMRTLDTDDLTKTLKTILDEIIFNPEIMDRAWWKQD